MQDDTAAIQRVLNGEREAFRLLLERYERPLFAFIRNTLGRPGREEDIAQDVFCAAYQHLASFDPDRGEFTTWLFTIARNRCLNERRRKTPLALESAPDPTYDPPPHDTAAEQETARHLDRALASLPHHQRTAFVLVQLAGQTYEQVAEAEGVRPGTVKSRVSRARERLRAAMARFLGENA